MTESNDRSADLAVALGELDQALRGFFFARVPAADAEDLLQECYLRVSRGLAGLQDQDRLAGWVFQIARNLVVDFRRAQKARAQLVSEPMAEIEEAASEPDLTQQVGEWLVARIDDLPEKYATVVRESEIEDRPHKEIAERLGLSVSGVKSRVQRGRALLEAKLEACCQLTFDRRGGLQDVERRAPGDGDDAGCRSDGC